MVAHTINSSYVAAAPVLRSGIGGVNAAMNIDPRYAQSMLPGMAKHGRMRQVPGQLPGSAGQINGAPKPVRGSPEGDALKTLGAVGATSGTLMAAEFMGPIGGWGVRNTLGKLPKWAGGRFFHDIAGVPRALINTLYETPVDQLFGRQGRANFSGALHQYSTGSYGSMNHGEWKAGAGETLSNGRVREYATGKPVYAKAQKTWWKPTSWFARGEQSGVKNLESSVIGRKAGEWENALGGAKSYESAATKVKGKWYNPKAIGQRMLKGRALTVGFKVTAVAALAYLGIKVTSDLLDKISQAKEVYQDMYGKELSTWALIMSPATLPPMMQQLRHNMFEHVMPHAGEIVTESLDKYSVMDGFRNFRMMPFMAGMALHGGMMFFEPSGDFLGSYTDIKDALASGTRVPPEAYAQMIVASSPAARQSGGVESRLVQGLATEYAAAQTVPAVILKEIADKKPFNDRAQRIAKAIVAQDQLKHKAPATDKPLVPEDKAAAPSSKVAQDTPSMKAATNDAAHQGKVIERHREVAG